jgi:TPR repeat protein
MRVRSADALGLLVIRTAPQSGAGVASRPAPASGGAQLASAEPTAPEAAAEQRARAERLLARGEAYLANGNVMGARDFFERAADAGLAAGALQLAVTYDPVELKRLEVQGVKPDVALARKWYERARQLNAAAAAGL